MCKYAHPHSNTEPDSFFLTGFIRINPSTAPLNPPGAAPTLTTISDEVGPLQTSPSTTTSPSNFLSKESSTSKNKSKRRKRSNPFGAKAAKEGVVGTENEKRRTQTIADSLDLGGDLQVDEIDEMVGESGQTIERRKTVAMEVGLGFAP